MLMGWLRTHYTDVHYYEEKAPLYSVLSKNYGINQGLITIMGTYGRSRVSRILHPLRQGKIMNLSSTSLFIANTQ
jgi:hypothetical protein